MLTLLKFTELEGTDLLRMNTKNLCDPGPSVLSCEVSSPSVRESCATPTSFIHGRCTDLAAVINAVFM